MQYTCLSILAICIFYVYILYSIILYIYSMYIVYRLMFLLVQLYTWTELRYVEQILPLKGLSS